MQLEGSPWRVVHTDFTANHRPWNRVPSGRRGRAPRERWEARGVGHLAEPEEAFVGVAPVFWIRVQDRRSKACRANFAAEA